MPNRVYYYGPVFEAVAFGKTKDELEAHALLQANRFFPEGDNLEIVDHAYCVVPVKPRSSVYTAHIVVRAKQVMRSQE